jgi:two-component system, chemotaxis family, chemotaxis protein CheY
MGETRPLTRRIAARVTKTLLVVDDDPDLRAVLGEALESEGYAVALAADGLEAIRKINGLRPALILLDIMMPRMDGFAFAEELERRGLRSEMPILVLSAGGRAERAAERIGAEGYVAKPFELGQLLDEVSRLAAA